MTIFEHYSSVSRVQTYAILNNKKADVDEVISLIHMYDR